MTSRVFRDEASGAKITQRTSASGPIVDKWLSQFGDPTTWVRSVTHIGADGAGRPIYRISIQRGNTAFVQTLADTGLEGIGLISPNLGLTDPGARSGISSLANEAKNLRMAKARWISFMTNPDNQISQNERNNFVRLINNWTGTAQDLQDSMQIASKNLPFGATGELQDGGFDSLTIGGLGGGGGGGSFGPEYVKPDRRVVEDFVTGTMVSLAGTVLDDELDRIVNLYMSDHRRNFDSPNETIDPSQSVVEAVRGTKDYVTLHTDRPESADERTWVSDRRKAAERGGLTVGRQEDFAITQATVAGDLPDVEVAASVAQLQTSGKAEGVIERRIRNVAQGIFGVVSR